MARAREWVPRSHPERAVDDAVYGALLTHFPEASIHRQYRGWRRPSGGRAALIPDFLIRYRDIAIVVEVKASHASSSAGHQVRRYMEAASLMDGVNEVYGAIAAHTFSALIPDDIVRIDVCQL